MRTSWNGVLRGVTLIAFLVVVGLPSAFADNAPNPLDPPQARIHPPTGVTSQARISPPSGVTDAPSFFELVLDWLRAQARIASPIG